MCFMKEGKSDQAARCIKSIALVIILDLIHLVAWSDLISFRKHIYYLLTGGNIVGVLEVYVIEDVK